MISIKLTHALNLRHPKRLIHALDEMPRSPAPPHDPTLLEHAIHGTVLVRHSAKEDSFAVIDVPVHDLGQHLRAGAVDRGDAVDVEDDVLVVFRCSHAWQRGVGGVGTVEFESPETVFQVACVGKGEGFGYLDDEAAFDEFEGLGVVFRVLKLVLCAWYFAQDLNARFC